MGTIRVGNGLLRKNLYDAITSARPGDVLVLDAGTYDFPDGFTVGSLTLTGAKTGGPVILDTVFTVTGLLRMSNVTVRSAAFLSPIRVKGAQARVELNNVDLSSDPTGSYVGIWVDGGSLLATGCRIGTSPSNDDPLGTSILIEGGGSAQLTDTHCGSSIVELRGSQATLSNTVMGCLTLSARSRVTSRDVVQLGNGADRRALLLAEESSCTLATLRTTDAWAEALCEDSFLRLASLLPAPGTETPKLAVHTSGRAAVDAPADIVDILGTGAPSDPAPAAPKALTWRADAGIEWAQIQAELGAGDTLLLEEGEYTIPDAIVLDFDIQGTGRAEHVHLTASLAADDGAVHSVSSLTLSGFADHNRMNVRNGSEVRLSSVTIDQQDAASFYAVNVEGGRLVIDGCEVRGHPDADSAESVRVVHGELTASGGAIESLLVGEGGSARLSDCDFTVLAAIDGGRIDSADELQHRALHGDRYACVALRDGTIDLNRVSSDDSDFAVKVEGGTFSAVAVEADDGGYVLADAEASLPRLPEGMRVIDPDGNPFGQQTQTALSADDAPAAEGEQMPARPEVGIAEDDATEADDEASAPGDAAAADPMAEIDALMGLQTVKKQIRTFLQTVEFNQAREAQGLPGVEMTLHSLFLGGPGTGKTTVARLLGQALHDAGVIPSAKFQEVDPEKLISPNIGETAQKTRGVLEDALGGVLFVDEAYGLYQDSGTNYGQQAVDTILKFMEDHRREIVVIFAGYADRMQDFLGMNPGLRSRIPNDFQFEDYSDREIVEIGLSMLAAQNYTVNEELYGQVIRRKYAAASDRSNARWVRNRNEDLLRILISRVVETKSSDTTTILDEDLHAFAGGDVAAKEDRVQELLAELDEMLGLEPVKRFVRDLVVQVQADRRLVQAGVATSQPTS
ncbi:MAG: AAA family ATPase, partial [Microbacterium sp.]